jgi:hypothetical protein
MARCLDHRHGLLTVALGIVMIIGSGGATQPRMCLTRV